MELQLVLIFVLNFVTILLQTNFFVTRLTQTEIFVTKLIQTEIFVTYAPEIRSVQIESAFTSFVFTMCFAPLLFQLRARLDLTHVSGTSCWSGVGSRDLPTGMFPVDMYKCRYHYTVPGGHEHPVEKTLELDIDLFPLLLFSIITQFVYWFVQA